MERREAQRDIRIEEILDAFPGKDPAGHRRYHDLIAENTMAKTRLYNAIKEKTISGLIWSVLVGGGMLLWRGFLHYIGRG
jgi:hypothetical protein